MNIVLLHTGRPMRVDQVVEARRQLRVDQSAHLSVISWNPPAGALPVDQHILVRTVGGSRSLPVLAVEPEVAPAALEDDGSTGLALGPGGPEEESADTVDKAAGVDEAADVPVKPGPASARLTPAGVAHALRWRTNRARLAVRRRAAVARRGLGSSPVRNHPTVARVLGSTKLRRARKAVVPDTHVSRYAAACLASREVHQLVDRADMVVAMDARTHRAAWLLARRHPRPDVVVGLAAAQRTLQARADTTAGLSA